VVAQVEKRLRKLEERSQGIGGGGPRCPECGRLPDREPGPEDTYELIIDTPDDEELPEEDEYCPACGELALGVIRFDDD
jgi:hypothetical protein